MGTASKRALASAGGLAAAGLSAAAAWRAIRRKPGHPVRPGHPLFARYYALLARIAEHGELGRRRSAVAAGATGMVLEVGAGTGEGFKHYRSLRSPSSPGESVTGVVAIEPDQAMLRIAIRRVRETPVPMHLVQARGEDLPFRDATFDTAVATLVLCSVDDPARTLLELRRVLRPGGQLVFLEHVRASDNARLAHWQDKLEHLWGVVAGGCHPNRTTLDAIREAGFEPNDVESFDLKPGIPLVHPHVQGTALRP